MKTTTAPFHPTPIHVPGGEVIPDANARPVRHYADVVVVMGIGLDKELLEEARRRCEQGGLNGVFVGDAQSEITATDLRTLMQSGRVGPDTHVIFMAHGEHDPKAAGHVVHLTRSGATTNTPDLIATLYESAPDAPGWTGPLHLISCESGELAHQIEPGGELWERGNVLLYAGRSPTLLHLPEQDLLGTIDFLAECKKHEIPVTGEQAFAHLANWTGDCISMIGRGFEQPVILHAPKRGEDLQFHAMEREWQRLEAREKAGDPLHGRLEGTGADIARIVAAEQKLADPGLDEKKRTAKVLLIRADRGTVASVASLLEKHPDLLDCEAPDGHTPLTCACMSGNREVVQFLLATGANVKPRIDPLQIACERRDIEMARGLCRHGADPYSSGWMERAKTHRQTDLVKAMAQGWTQYQESGRPAAVPVADPRGAEGMASATDVRDEQRAGAARDAKALRTAVKRGQLDAAKEILSRAPGVIDNQGGIEGRTPLNLACRAVDIPMVKLLVERGANPNAEDKRGKTPLWVALTSRNIELVEYLCSKGANPTREASALLAQAGDRPVLDAMMRGWETYTKSRPEQALARL